MENRLKQYGFVAPEITPDNWVLGSITAPKVFEPKGDWTKYLPEKEYQHKNGIETYNCTSFGTLSIIETLINRITSERQNYSDRFVGIVAGTRPPGNTPHAVAEAIRKNRLISEEMLPFSDDIRTVEEYYSFKGADEQECKNKALAFPYELNHYWLWTGDQTKEQRTAKIREALKYSPLGISVSAWTKKGNVYVDNGVQNNHWTMLYGEDKNGWKVFDSYDNTHKILSFDHNIQFAKGYHLVLKEAEQVSLIKKLLSLYQELVELLTQKKTMTNSEKLATIAESKVGIDITNDNLVSDEVSCAFALTTILREYDPTINIIYNTGELYRFLKRDERFVEVQQPIEVIERGSILVAPTGYNSRPEIMPHGHCWIATHNEVYMSNDSITGLWSENYTRETARNRYVKRGGFPIYVFKLR